MMSFSYPKEYYEFISRFNEGEYYECHDLLEEIWMTEKDNKFLQGLLQMSVGIHHFESGNIKGARLLLESAYKYLNSYRPQYWGMNLTPVLEYIQKCLDVLPEKDRLPISDLAKIPFPHIRLYLNHT